MKKIDTRGFVIVETIIVAVFIIGICTFLFANFLPLIADYERVSNYDTVTAKYKANEVRKMLLREIEANSNVVNIFTGIPSDKGYKRYENYDTTNNGVTTIYNALCAEIGSPSYAGSRNYCNKLLSKDYLNVKEVIITSFKLGKIKQNIKSESGNRALKEYIDYLPSYSKYSSKYDDYYRLIVVFNDGQMANIEVHYEIG